MDNIMIVLINLDSSFFNDNLDYHLLLDYIDKTRYLNNIDKSLLIFYSKFQEYTFKNKIDSICNIRDEYPDIVLGRYYSKNNNFLTSDFYSRNDENKKSIFNNIFNNYIKCIDVDAILILDDNLKINEKNLEIIFKGSKIITRSFIPSEDNKVLKKII